MDEERLKKLFERSPPPPVRLEAQEETVRLARRAWERARRNPVEQVALSTSTNARHSLWPVSAAAAFVVLVFVASFLLWDRARVAEESLASTGSFQPGMVEFERETSLLRELQSLFAGRLQFVVLNNGDTRVEVSPGPVFEDQPVAVRFRRGGNSWLVLSYSGNTVQLEIEGTLIEFDLLVAGDGEVIMAGKDFVWSSSSGNGAGGFSIEARVISG